ncbi:MAG: rhomboid family protein [Verrucomicrobia bacterium]|nr:MAG: rhomboid family protein [Verrucomicrobiota bacterium]
MQTVLHQRCFNHAHREAVARCPECQRFFCRECVTEHEDVVICAACLAKHARVPLFRRPAFARIKRTLQFACGFFFLWFFFYLIGAALLALPTSFHEGTLWQVDWFDKL